MSDHKERVTQNALFKSGVMLMGAGGGLVIIAVSYLYFSFLASNMGRVGQFAGTGLYIALIGFLICAIAYNAEDGDEDEQT